jgi:hypothetical protein
VNRPFRTLLGATAVVVGLTGVPALANATPSSVSIACNDVAALKAAIIAANNGTGPPTILLAHSCVYKLTSVASSDDGLPEVTATVNLIGRVTTIARVSGPAFNILEVSGGDLTVSGIDFTGGDETEGGCLEPENDGTLLLVNVIIHDCTATDTGGGIYVDDASVTIVGSHIVGNSAPDGGGIYIDNGSDVQILGSTITQNLAEFGGGGYVDDGTVLFRNSAVYRNTAFAGGGGLFNDTSPTNVAIVNSWFGPNVPDNCEPTGTIVGCHF